MNFLEIAQLVNEWLSGMPESQRVLVSKVFYCIGILSVVFLVWRLSNSEKQQENGKIETQWHHPKSWYQRYMQLKSESYKNAPEGAVAFIKGANKLLLKLQTVFTFLMGFALVAVYVWLDFEFVWVGLIGAAMIGIAYFVNEKPSEFKSD